MALKVTVRPSTSTAAPVNIPESVQKEVEDLYKQLQDNPGSEIFIEFGDEDERITWTSQAKTYAKSRPKGALTIRQLPSKNLPVNQARFNITADLPANGERNGRK